MELLNKLQDSIIRWNNEERTYAILVKRNIYEMLIATQELWYTQNPLMEKPISTYCSVIVEIDNEIDNDFKILTKKQYDEWKENKSKE